ncbi:MAG TPA: Asp-tRNA(Asn)/Glu-tRNA(Gln) amidotransferase subunit GatB, partial [Acidimicrobiales bacterium]|nr:Asp-tRNA(Asn)/Glu-tRNA(Gln) amidotransferase subunit GatB [Acidimicrobiales bacterium]
GTRCEIKNLNSLRSLSHAIDFEAQRQVDLIEGGGVVRQETRHWDETKGETSTMRVKEEAEDYRYFREPDLVDLAPDAAWQERVRASLGPMPAERRLALRGMVGTVTSAQLDALDVVVDLGFDNYVLAALAAHVDAGLALARAANELAADAEHIENLTKEAFVATLSMEQSGELSATQAKTVLAELMASGGDPHAIASQKGFEQLSADSLGDVVAELIEANPDEWTRYRDGDDKLAQFFIGQVMKVTKGQANGKAVIAELVARR